MPFIQLSRLDLLLNEVSPQDLTVLDAADTNWLPFLKDLPPENMRSALCDAVNNTETKKVALNKVAFIRCCLFPRQRIPMRQIYNLRKVMTEAECTTLLLRMKTILKRCYNAANVAHAMRALGNAVHICLITEEEGGLSGEENVAYLVVSMMYPRVAAHSVESSMQVRLDACLHESLRDIFELPPRVPDRNIDPGTQATPSSLCPSLSQNPRELRLEDHPHVPPCFVSGAHVVENAFDSAQALQFDMTTSQGLFFCYNCFEDFHTKEFFERHWHLEHSAEY